MNTFKVRDIEDLVFQFGFEQWEQLPKKKIDTDTLKKHEQKLTIGVIVLSVLSVVLISVL